MANHLIFQERELLYRLLRQGKSRAEVAKLMNRDRSTIYRELRRNSGARGYRPKQAQRLANERRQRSRRGWKLEDPEVHQYLSERIEQAWSPDQIANRSRRDFPRQAYRHMSRQTIYNWIANRAPAWRAQLRRQGRPPEKRGKLTDCVRIDEDGCRNR